MATAHINIGSNIGDRHALIELAVIRIMEAFGREAVRSSAIVESEPWGYTSPNRFLNIGLAVEAGHMTPHEILRKLQEIERSIHPASHRLADGSYADRMIDIDLIAVDELTVESADLVLPHPRMHLRPFVLEPMAELAPEWRHPRLKLTPAEMITSINRGADGPCAQAPAPDATEQS